MDRVEEMLRYPLFQHIKPEALGRMLQCVQARYRKFPKNCYLAMIEDEIRSIGIVCKGSVQMVKEDYWGHKTLLAHMREGEMFGETFVCSASFAAQVSFVTAEKTEILFLNYDKALHACSMACTFHHRLVENMLKCIAGKNIRLMEKIEIISQKTLRDKLMTYLTMEAQKSRSIDFLVALNRTEMAEYLCADRSAISRELVSMQEDGLIFFEKNKFRICTEYEK